MALDVPGGRFAAAACVCTGMELLDTVDAAEKTIVILSDGEIIMSSDDATAESSCTVVSVG